MTALDEALVRLRDAFARQATDRALQLEKALVEDDQAAIVEIAHKIAGIAGMVGFADLGDRAAQLEYLVDSGAAVMDCAAATSQLAEELFQLGAIHQPEANDD